MTNANQLCMANANKCSLTNANPPPVDSWQRGTISCMAEAENISFHWLFLGWGSWSNSLLYFQDHLVILEELLFEMVEEWAYIGCLCCQVWNLEMIIMVFFCSILGCSGRYPIVDIPVLGSQVNSLSLFYLLACSFYYSQFSLGGIREKWTQTIFIRSIVLLNFNYWF